jgi:hypothetical protein
MQTKWYNTLGKRGDAKMALNVKWDRRMTFVIESADTRAWADLFFALRKHGGSSVAVNSSAASAGMDGRRWTVDLPQPAALPARAREEISQALERTPLTLIVQTTKPNEQA